jgi:uracil-DNA glycosylase family 4
MPESFDQLIDATIEHLETLKEQGVRYLPVSAETAAALAAQAPAGKLRQTSSKGRPADTAPVPYPASGSGPSPVQPMPAAIPAKESLAKQLAIAELRDRALQCVKCPNLASSRKNVVFGVGSIDAEIMFVGEAPGADEDEQGEPFVGKAGQLLTKIIQTMGVDRNRVYIANILKCRPDTPGQSAGNRKPSPAEMQTCIPYLHAQIDLIQPKVLVALGATAVEGLLGKVEGITRLRGNWKTYRNIPLMPTYHPAYLLRNQAMSEKRRVWEDMLQVMERIGMPITEKQRNYFLS